MKGRITGLSVIIVLLFGLILGQAVFIQVHRAAALNGAPGNPRNFENVTQFQRGEILASNGLVLAKSIPSVNQSFPGSACTHSGG